MCLTESRPPPGGCRATPPTGLVVQLRPPPVRRPAGHPLTTSRPRGKQRCPSRSRPSPSTATETSFWCPQATRIPPSRQVPRRRPPMGRPQRRRPPKVRLQPRRPPKVHLHPLHRWLPALPPPRAHCRRLTLDQQRHRRRPARHQGAAVLLPLRAGRKGLRRPPLLLPLRLPLLCRRLPQRRYRCRRPLEERRPLLLLLRRRGR